jgi:methionyl-tRNA formyltransferase
MKIIFMGTPDFAVPCLQEVVQDHEVVAVITQPDKAQGRGRKIIATPVKTCALELGLIIKQPQNINEINFVEYLKSLNADIMIVVAYGQILKKRVLTITEYGVINVHASLLPKWRGGAPIHRSLLSGDSKTGISIMKVERKLDSGPVYSQAEVKITEDMNVGILHDILAQKGAKMLAEVLKNIQTLKPVTQNHQESTYAKLIVKEDRIINFNDDVNTIFNQVRGLNPWPIAYTYYKGKQVQVWQCQKINSNKLNTKKNGQIIDIASHGPVVKCLNGAVVLTKLKPAGKKQMTGSEFCRGYRCTVADYFGESEE